MTAKVKHGGANETEHVSRAERRQLLDGYDGKSCRSEVCSRRESAKRGLQAIRRGTGVSTNVGNRVCTTWSWKWRIVDRGRFASQG